MPTGYTATLVEKGQSFPEFVMGCARAFGALISMRDHPMDAPIPDELPPEDSYSTKALAAANAEVARLEGMTSEERLAFGQEAKERDVKSYRDYLLKEAEENARIDGMIAKVNAWTPPTSDHTELKAFMLQQLDVSRHDGGYAAKMFSEAQQKEPLAYFSDALAGARLSVEYNIEQVAKDRARHASRSEWVKALRGSLNGQEAK
jgi:hypothetical protein